MISHHGNGFIQCLYFPLTRLNKRDIVRKSNPHGQVLARNSNNCARGPTCTYRKSSLTHRPGRGSSSSRLTLAEKTIQLHERAGVDSSWCLFSLVSTSPLANSKIQEALFSRLGLKAGGRPQLLIDIFGDLVADPSEGDIVSRHDFDLSVFAYWKIYRFKELTLELCTPKSSNQVLRRQTGPGRLLILPAQ
ncbi:hypothetical protein BDW68DRAFT_168076 [Aspergillus falconensis]